MGLVTSIAAIGMSAYGAYSSAKGSHDAKKAAAKLGEYNAQVSEQDAQATEVMTKFEQVRQAQRGTKTMGTVRAKLGASGAVLSEGAPLHVQAAQAFELELENSLIGQQGRTQAARYRSDAQAYLKGAQMARAQAGSATTAGWLNAGSTILGGLSSMSQQGMFSGSSGKGYYSGSAPGD